LEIKIVPTKRMSKFIPKTILNPFLRSNKATTANNKPPASLSSTVKLEISNSFKHILIIAFETIKTDHNPKIIR